MERKISTVFIVILVGFSLSAMAQLPTYLPSDGLVGWWPFNGNANDESGNGHNGTVIGSTLSSDRFGNINQAYYLNGQTDYISVPSDSALTPNNLTLSAWVNIPSNYTANNPIGRIIRSRYFGYLLYYDSISHDIVSEFYHNSVNYSHSASDSMFVNDNSWHHVVSTFNGTLNKLYIDGDLISYSASATDSIYYNSDGIIAFGRDGNNSSPNTALFQGLIDDIGIWNRALTQQEITNLYNANLCYLYITVTDTLLINLGITGFNPLAYQNTIRIYPNPTRDHITIDNGDLTKVIGYQMEITNSIGQQIFQSPINQQQFYLDLTTWGGAGLYFVYIRNGHGSLIDVKKIILQ